jgi:hypothetical protein
MLTTACTIFNSSHNEDSSQKKGEAGTHNLSFVSGSVGGKQYVHDDFMAMMS